jgi:hypothetical protein
MKHGAPDGYNKRFVHGSDLKSTFQQARRTVLQKSKRPPTFSAKAGYLEINMA